MAYLWCKWCHKRHPFCGSCGIGMGGQHHEDAGIRVGRKRFCPFCYQRMLRVQDCDGR